MLTPSPLAEVGEARGPPTTDALRASAPQWPSLRGPGAALGPEPAGQRLRRASAPSLWRRRRRGPLRFARSSPHASRRNASASAVVTWAKAKRLTYGAAKMEPGETPDNRPSLNSDMRNMCEFASSLKLWPGPRPQSTRFRPHPALIGRSWTMSTKFGPACACFREIYAALVCLIGSRSGTVAGQYSVTKRRHLQVVGARL